ncbi:kinase-like domain-containing protein [Pyrenochaeta sp. MPI-SDFR-AT-0127]|nr:kinase-like domain-containing protein [Pyrenochaeta sp. MPI-SDFR-AT-0127]
MSSPTDLTTEDGLRSYLKANGRSKEVSVTLLSGGTANYVYRVAGIHGFTSIFKHAAPYLHSNHNFALDPTRMDYEAQALDILSPADSVSPISRLLPRSTVHAVRLLSYDKEKKLLCIEDGGSQNLKDSYGDQKLDIAKAGEELGKWIAALHMCSTTISLALPDQKEAVEENRSKNNPVAVQIYRHSYRNLYTALSQYGHDTKLADRINEDFGSLLETDDECVCHGDYWPGNVLVRLYPTQDKPADLTIVDFEMVRRGTSATDVGQFAAEAFLLDRFRGGRGLLPVFLNEYIRARKENPHNSTVLDRAWLKRVVVHWAVHVAFWPTRVEWTDSAGTQELVDIGVGVLKAVLDDDWEKLLLSPLFKDVKGALGSVLEAHSG